MHTDTSSEGCTTQGYLFDMIIMTKPVGGDANSGFNDTFSIFFNTTDASCPGDISACGSAILNA
jgi:hypothetical protein